MLDITNLHCPNCGEAQDCSLVVPLFGISQPCTRCHLASWLATWRKPDGADLGREDAHYLRQTYSTLRRPAVFVIVHATDEFHGWIGIELERALYEARVTTLHNTNLLARTQDSCTEDICRYADHVIVVGHPDRLQNALRLDSPAAPDGDVARKILVVSRGLKGEATDPEVPYKQIRLTGPSQDEVLRVVARVTDVDGGGNWLALPLPPHAVLGSIVDPINALLIEEIVRSPMALRQLGWRDVEKLVAEILAGLGHEVELQRGTKDGGVDIVAFQTGHTSAKLLVQVKHPRSGRFVGIEPIQQLLFLKDQQHATKAVFATTTGFTKGAQKLIETYKWEIEGRDRDGILGWARAYLDRVRNKA